jgi:hypothetical protein
MSVKPSSKPGRPAALAAPSQDQRQRVMLGIAGGLSATTLAVALGVSRRTFGRVFAAEIERGRALVMLEMLACLHKAARRGNGAAAKALLGFVERAKPPAEPEVAVVDRWAGLAERVAGADISPAAEIPRLDS